MLSSIVALEIYNLLIVNDIENRNEAERYEKVNSRVSSPSGRQIGRDSRFACLGTRGVVHRDVEHERQDEGISINKHLPEWHLLKENCRIFVIPAQARIHFCPACAGEVVQGCTGYGPKDGMTVVLGLSNCHSTFTPFYSGCFNGHAATPRKHTEDCHR
jgi:hypothetical protein